MDGPVSHRDPARSAKLQLDDADFDEVVRLSFRKERSGKKNRNRLIREGEEADIEVAAGDARPSRVRLRD